MNSITFKKWNLILGWAAFATAFIVYFLTVEPTVSFWDCGEYIPTAEKLQVGHAPGAPLFQITGAFFAMFAPSKDKIAFMVNMVSVFSAAFTILFMYWSTVLLLKNVIGEKAILIKKNAAMVLGSAFIGCIAFTFSDSFWFNATEAEVYAMASLFIAMILWAGLRWGEALHQPRGNRWLLLIALLTGLSFGVHFLALLTLPAVGLIYYFKKYKTITFKNFLIANIAIVALLFFIFKLLMPYTMALFSKTEIFMVNRLGLPFNSGTIFTAFALAGFFYAGLRFTRKRGMPALNTAILCLLFLLMGFSSWMMLPIRSNAGVVLNENKPSDATELLSYYNMESYGEKSTFYGPLYTSVYTGLDKNEPYKDAKPNYERDYKTGRYVIINNYKNELQNPDSGQNAILPRMASDRHTVEYMNLEGPPKFRIDPDYPFERELGNYGIDVSSLTDEELQKATGQLRGQLEDVVSQFRASYSKGEIGNEEYDKFLKAYGRYFKIEKPSFAQNMKFMATFQFGYMYLRYLLWNFAGKQNDLQGKYDNINGNWLSGINFIDALHLGPQENLTSDMKNNKGRNIYYFLPFLLGIIGFIYHAKKDLKSFYVLLALFLFTSFALKIFLNESPFEVRERDYVLVGSFYVFAIWIAFGVYALYALMKKYFNPKIAGPAVLTATLLAAPVLMAKENWNDHDRSGRYTALSTAKAYLDSCDPNAILFTIGDLDTFPLWYAQEVEGYRTDVRVVCSTLLPGDWYIDQMKRQAYDSTPLPISFLHKQYAAGTRDYILYNPVTKSRINIDDFMDFIKSDDDRAKVELNNGHKVNFYPSDKIRIPVNKQEVLDNNVVSTDKYDSIVPDIDIDLPKDAIYKHHMIMLDIIRNNHWKRPVYFTGGSYDDEDYLWMKDYLQLQGLVYKLVPVKTPAGKDESPLDYGYVDAKKMYDTVKKWNWGNSNNPDVYLDPVTRRNSLTFRNSMARLSDTLIAEGKTEKAREVIDIAMKNMPPESFGYYFSCEPFADGYYKTGQQKKARELLAKLAKKYHETLTYYTTQPRDAQNTAYQDIAGTIERYRSLLLIMKDNNDTAYYKKYRYDFNRCNMLFSRFGRENE